MSFDGYPFALPDNDNAAALELPADAVSVKLRFHKYQDTMMQPMTIDGLAAIHKMLQHATRYDRASREHIVVMAARDNKFTTHQADELLKYLWAENATIRIRVMVPTTIPAIADKEKHQNIDTAAISRNIKT